MTRRWPTLDGAPTRVIAHRGASGARPEHTLAAYELALEQGADVLEPDLVMARDGTLVVRHDRGLARSTNIASRPAFATRRHGDDWPVDAFTRAELAELRAVQPFVQRDRSHDEVHPLLDFAQLLAWAEMQAASRGTALTLYPELKHASTFIARGLDPVPALLRLWQGLDPARVKLWLQCFELEPLQRLRHDTGLPVYLLIDGHADWREMLTRHAGAIDGFGADKALLHDAAGGDAGFVAAAHARGLQVHVWTYRDDQLPEGVARVEDELEAAFALGVDAVFCDFPATALACRARWAQA